MERNRLFALKRDCDSDRVSIASQHENTGKNLENISLYTNVYSVLRLRCEKENAKCLNKFISTDKDFYLVKGCHHLICDECYSDIMSQNLSSQSFNIKKYCSHCHEPISRNFSNLKDKVSALAVVDTKKKFIPSEEDLSKIYLNSLNLMNEIEANIDVLDFCQKHAGEKVEYVYKQHPDNYWKDNFMCEKCVEEKNLKNDDNLINIEESLLSCCDQIEEIQMNLEKDLRNAKLNLNKLEEKRKQIVKGAAGKQKEFQDFFENLKVQLSCLYEDKKNSIKNDKHKDLLLIEERINELERLKKFGDKGHQEIDDALILLIANADYTKKNLPFLLGTKPFVSGLVGELNGKKAQCIAPEKIIKGKEHAWNIDAVKTKLDTYYDFQEEMVDISKEIILD